MSTSKPYDIILNTEWALRSVRPRNRYWLRIVVKRGTPVGELIQEAEEIMKILGSIVSKVRRRFN